MNGNWGKWGPEDEIGAANYVAPQTIVDAASLVKQGRVYSLAIPLSPAIRNPRGRVIAHITSAPKRLADTSVGGAEDAVFMHTHSTTHIDSLAHIWLDGRMYNGYRSEEVSANGANRCGVDKLNAIVTRGVLLDVATHRGVERLDIGYTIGVGDLEKCAEAQGVELRRGDAVLIRTGWISALFESPESFFSGEPGIGMAAAKWLQEKQVSAVGADNFAIEVVTPGKIDLSVHIDLIRNQGCHLLELLQLDDLAADKAYEFMFVAAPLRLEKGLGSPLNPLAII